MKSVKYIIILVLFSAVQAHGQNWLWAVAPQAKPNVITPAYIGVSEWLLKTGPGNSLYTGFCNQYSNITIGPNLICDTVVSYYYGPMFQTIVAKYDLSGNVIWTLASSYGEAFSAGILPDDSGNVYVYGFANNDSVVFGSYIASYTRDIPDPSGMYFLLKITSVGDIAWLRSGQASFFNNTLHSGFVMDMSSSVYLTTSVDSGIFLSKFDPAGNQLWSKLFRGDNQVEVVGMAVYNNRIYATGNFQSSQFILGTDTFIYKGQPVTSGDPFTNSFMACFDTAGNVIWANCSHSQASPNDLKVDNKGNLYVCGYVMEGPYMTWGVDSLVIPTQGPAGFFASVDTNGNTRWLKVFPQKIAYDSWWTENRVDNIAIDPCGHIWICGSIDTPAGMVLDTMTLYGPPGSPDPMFIAAFTDSGTLLHVYTLSSGGGNEPSALAADTFGNIYLSGSFVLHNPFVIGNDSFYAYSATTTNPFLAKFNPATSVVTDTQADICPGGSIILQAPPSYAKYFWNTDSVGTSLAVSSGGIYPVYCYQGCDLVETQVAQVNEIILNSFVEDTGSCYIAGNAITLDPVAPTNATVIWSTGQSTGTLSVTETGKYWSAVSLDGCSATDTFNVNVYDCNCVVSVPDAFTPNDDGLNDRFGVVHQACAFQEFSFAIYDKWGKRIFKTSDPQHLWDGTYKGKPQDVDVYMYYIDYKTDRDHSTRHLKGAVTLIR